ncbi:ABC-type carbohydrate transport system, permease component [Desulfurococcaceae archaeon AG1]|jgi:multiple sugar transport system permease protein|nr:ABC-type carbohydrate transport system, permease component [Desulfurococcaceae archaeon AG1]
MFKQRFFCIRRQGFFWGKGIRDRSIYLLALPALAYLVSFTIYPILSNAFLSFFTYTLRGDVVWVGFRNYAYLAEDPFISRVIFNTLIYTVVAPMITVILAIPIAASLRRVGGVFLVPLSIASFIPATTAAIMWYLMLNPFLGISYYIYQYNWASSIYTVVIIEIWRSLPIAVLVIYSGLRSIPKHIEEAAYADGMVGVRKFLSVDLPLVSPQILTAFVLSMISGLFLFDPIYIGTSQAGPRVLDNLAFYVFENFYTDIRLRGYTATLIVIMTVLSTILAAIYIRLVSSRTILRIPMVSFAPSREMPKAIHYVVILLALIFTLLPIAWLLIVSLKSPKELLSIPPTIIPNSPTLDNYHYVISTGLPYLVTSLGIASINTFITILLSSMLGFAMAAYRFGGNRLLIYVLYLTATPTLIYIVPLFAMIRFFNVINTWWALIITYPIMTVPITTWIMYNYYIKFPKSIDEAAQADGMNRFRVFIKIAFPLSKGGMGVAAVYSFLISWGALLFPLAFTYSPYDLSNPLSFSGAQTFSVYVANLMSPVTANYGAVAAAGVISMIPPIILLIFIRRDLEKIWGR